VRVESEMGKFREILWKFGRSFACGVNDLRLARKLWQMPQAIVSNGEEFITANISGDVNTTI
jgi:hypothetical protein